MSIVTMTCIVVGAAILLVVWACAMENRRYDKRGVGRTAGADEQIEQVNNTIVYLQTMDAINHIPTDMGNAAYGHDAGCQVDMSASMPHDHGCHL